MSDGSLKSQWAADSIAMRQEVVPGPGRAWSCLDILRSRALAVWCSPLGAGVVASVVYAVLGVAFGARGLGQSNYPYFVYLADAFLHGQLALLDTPALTQDLSFFNGRYYLYWPPFPTLLYMPWVAAFGVGVTDAPVHLALAGTAVAMVSLLFREMDARGVAQLSTEKRAWLTAFFAFGTVLVTLAPYPRVWFTAQIAALALLCAAHVAALRAPRSWSPLLTGGLLACAFLCRYSTLLAGLWTLWYLVRGRDRTDSQSFFKIVLGWGSPIILALILLGVYNQLRFGSPLETGYAYHRIVDFFRNDYDQYGAFSLHYLPINVFYNVVAVPYLTLLGGNPHVDFWMGGSLFLMSPVFVLSLTGVCRSWKTEGWALAGSFLMGLIPMLLLIGTGWVAFGPRYTTDVTAPLLVATAIGCASISTRALARLSLISMIVYVPGAILYGARIM